MKAPQDTTSSDFIFSGEANESWNFSDHKEIASRGFNVLFSATHKGCRYLLKGLKSEYRESEIYQLQMLKEYRLGKSLKHEHICQTYSIAEDAIAGRCIVMEYVEGCNLKEWLEQKPSAALRHKVFVEILSALDYCHKKQITHCDIKPSNIMVTSSGNDVKLIDFGLSDNDNYLLLKQAGGTKGYMAPEQEQSKPTTDARTDIYALGCLMGELFAHRYFLLRRRCRQTDPQRRPQNVREVKRKYLVWRNLPWILACIVVAGGAIALGFPRPTVPEEKIVTTQVVVHDTIPVIQEAADTEEVAVEQAPNYGDLEQALWRGLEEIYRTETEHCLSSETYNYDIESELRRRCTMVVNNLVAQAPKQFREMLQKDAAAFETKLKATYREPLYECRLAIAKRNR